MVKPVLSNFAQMGELIIQRYERYLPTAFDESMSLLEKVNKVINYLNEMGLLLNDVVEQWNVAMEWIVNEGLTETVNTKLDEMATDGTLEQIINVDMLGTLGSLKTTTKEDLVSAINENFDKINSNHDDVTSQLAQIVTLNVKDYGAKGDKVTDDTNAIQSAIEYAKTLVSERLYDGANIFFPKGTYLISNTLIVEDSGISLISDNPNTAYLYANSPTFDYVYFDGRNQYIYHANFNLGIIATGNATSGVGLKLHKCIDGEFNVYMNGVYNGLELDGCGRLIFPKILIKQESRTSGASKYFIDLKGTYGINSDIHMTEVNFHQIKTRDNAFNFSIRSIDGLYVGRCHINGALIFQPSNGGFEKTIASVFFDMLYVDGSEAENIIFANSCDNYRNIKLGKVQCRDGAHGFVLATTGLIDFIQIDSLLIYDTVGNGIEFRTDHCKSLQIGNVMIKNANTGQQTTRHYALIGGENTQISNITLIGEMEFGSGLNIRSSSVNTQIGNVNLNRLTRITQSAPFISLYGTNISIDSISGIPNFVKGDIVIPVGQTKVTVTHTLGVSYDNKDIVLTPRSFGSYKISNLTPSSFDFELQTAPTETYYCGYTIHKRRFN